MTLRHRKQTPVMATEYLYVVTSRSHVRNTYSNKIALDTIRRLGRRNKLAAEEDNRR